MGTGDKRVRAVVDTNVLVRGVLSGRGASGAILAAVESGRFELVTSPGLLDELVEVLTRRRVRRGRLSLEEIAMIRVFFEQRADVVAGDYVIDWVTTDPKDNPLVACALEGGADYLVTTDARDLLPRKAVRVAGYRTVQIVRPHVFLHRLG